MVLDYQMCPGRLTNGSGLLNSVVNGSGNYILSFSNTPKLDPETVDAAENTPFGNLLVLGSDNRLRQLVAPSTAGWTIQTNATNEFVVGAPPAATIPDPLSVTDLVVTGQATIEDLEVNGDVELNGLAAGTAVSLLGFNATNQVVLTALSQGLGVSMFFESSTSPNASSPNSAKVSGDYLVIGNRLFDSGQDNIAVTTSESLTVNDDGTYLLFWSAQLRMGGSTSVGKFGVWLELNGTVVNYGNGRTDSNVSGVDVNNGVMYAAQGMDVRAYTAGTVIKLLFNENCPQEEAFEVRLIAVRIPNA